VLDATSIFQHRDMKLLWKKKIGCDKTKVAVSEFCEAFFSEACKVILSIYSCYIALLILFCSCQALDAGRPYLLKEKVNRKVNPDIALTRYLNELYNDNGDESLSVYELSSVLMAKEKEGHFLRPLDSIGFTVNFLLKQEAEFMTRIQFSYIEHKAGEDGVIGTADDEMKVLTNGVPLFVRPFHRALIIADVPLINADLYEYDHLALLMCDRPRNPIEKGVNAKSTIEYTVVHGSKCYVKRDINKTILSPHDCNWNAYKVTTSLRRAHLLHYCSA
jgi:hypothetical protein